MWSPVWTHLKVNKWWWCVPHRQNLLAVSVREITLTGRPSSEKSECDSRERFRHESKYRRGKTTIQRCWLAEGQIIAVPHLLSGTTAWLSGVKTVNSIEAGMYDKTEKHYADRLVKRELWQSKMYDLRDCRLLHSVFLFFMVCSFFPFVHQMQPHKNWHSRWSLSTQVV